MAWYEIYETDVLGATGAARYRRAPSPAVSRTPQKPDSGILAPATHIPPVAQPLPPAGAVSGGHSLCGFVEGMFSVAFGGRRDRGAR